MGVLLHLATSTVDVEPGRTAQIELTVHNNGSVVDRITFEALGPGATWTTFEPPSLSLMPGTEGPAKVTFSPPRESSVAAGPMEFGVRAASTEDPEGSTVEEGTLQIGAFSDVSTELLPRIVSGRRSGRARLAVDNRSNVAYDAELTGTSPAGGLKFDLAPVVVNVPPGGSELVKVRIAPIKTFWRGPNLTKPFTLELDANDASPGAHPAPTHPSVARAEGSFVQQALLPRWLISLIAAIVALAVLFVILWFAFLRPQIRSTAKTEAQHQLAAAGLAPASGGAATSPAGPLSASGGGGGGGGSTSPTTKPGSPPTTVAPAVQSGSTVNGSAQATGNGTTVAYTVPKGHILQVTDLLVENSAGSNGNLSLSRGGTTLMEWALPDFRDLDYHWINPTLFGPGSKMQLQVSGCSKPCTPAIYFAGQLVPVKS